MTQDLGHSCVRTLFLVHLVLQGRLDSGSKRHVLRAQSRLHELGVVEVVVVAEAQRRDQSLQDKRLVVHGAEGLGGVHVGRLVARVDVESFALNAWSGEEVKDTDLFDKTTVLAGRVDVVCLVIGVKGGWDCWSASCRTNESCELSIPIRQC